MTSSVPRRPVVVLLAGLILCVAAMAGAQEGEGGIPGGEMVRGVVTRVAGDTLTVKTETGDQVSVVTTTNTRVMRERQTGRLADVKVGDGVGAAGVMDPAKHTLHAAVLGVMDAEEVKKAQAELGKSYIVGRLAAVDMDALKLTIHRPDGVNQVIAVDEGTSFRRGGRGGFGPGGAAQAAQSNGGESITLADLKVGESVAGRGAVKGGVFVPTELHVFTPGSGRRRGPDAPAGGATEGRP